MRRLLKILALAAIFAIATTANATPSQGSSESSIPSLIASLDLKDDQKKKLEIVYDESDKQMKAIMSDKSLSEDARRARINEVNETINEALHKVLTQSQKKKLNQLRRKN